MSDIQIREDRMLWTDLETFGLDPEMDPIIEAGFKITNLNLKVKASFSVLVWDVDWYDDRFHQLSKDALDGDEGAKFVLDMHSKSGLWDAAREHGISVPAAMDEIHEFFDDYEVLGGDALAGSSIQFDRGMLKYNMPAIEQRTHYRNIDVSTVKELCRRYNPRVFASAQEILKPLKAHRSLSDLDDSISEFQFYRDNFLFDARGEA